jgi:hypothetical protein
LRPIGCLRYPAGYLGGLDMARAKNARAVFLVDWRRAPCFGQGEKRKNHGIIEAILTY